MAQSQAWDFADEEEEVASVGGAAEEGEFTMPELPKMVEKWAAARAEGGGEGGFELPEMPKIPDEVNPLVAARKMVWGEDDAPPLKSGEKGLCDYPGCDGDGRVMGGLAATELFQWWPIKAYRPCPECAKRGKRYGRTGQTLDEIVFKKNPKGGYYGDELDE